MAAVAIPAVVVAAWLLVVTQVVEEDPVLPMAETVVAVPAGAALWAARALSVAVVAATAAVVILVEVVLLVLAEKILAVVINPQEQALMAVLSRTLTAAVEGIAAERDAVDTFRLVQVV